MKRSRSCVFKWIHVDWQVWSVVWRFSGREPSFPLGNLLYPFSALSFSTLELCFIHFRSKTAVFRLALSILGNIRSADNVFGSFKRLSNPLPLPWWRFWGVFRPAMSVLPTFLPTEMLTWRLSTALVERRSINRLIVMFPRCKIDPMLGFGDAKHHEFVGYTSVYPLIGDF